MSDDITGKLGIDTENSQNFIPDYQGLYGRLVTVGLLEVEYPFFSFNTAMASQYHSHATGLQGNITLPSSNESTVTATSPHQASILEFSTLEIVLKDSSGNQITEYKPHHISIISDKNIRVADVLEISEGEFEVHVTGLEIGEHELMVTVLGNQLPSLTVNVEFTPTEEPYLYSWGDNYYATLANEDLSTNDVQYDIEVVENLGNIDSLVSSTRTAAALSENRLLVWGFDFYGVTGIGQLTESYTTLPRILDEGPWKTIDLTYYSGVGIKTDGTLWVWGSNQYGLLAVNGPPVIEASPVQVGTDTDWKAVSAGRDHIAAIKEGGALWTWGDNSYGATGLGTTSSNTYTPTLVNNLPTCKYVHCTDSITFVITTDGDLYAAGDRSFFAMADGGSESGNETEFIQAATTVNKKWISISSVGKFSFLAISANNDVYAWGANFTNGLGNIGDLNGRVEVPTKIEIDSDNTWYQIDGGYSSSHMLALRYEGQRNFSLWSWGTNSIGQLGLGNGVSEEFSPVQVGLDEDWNNISSSGSYSLATKKQMTVPDAPSQSESSVSIVTDETTAGDDPAVVEVTLLDSQQAPLSDVYAFDFSFSVSNGSGNEVIERTNVDDDSGVHEFSIYVEAGETGTLSIDISVFGTLIFQGVEITFV